MLFDYWIPDGTIELMFNFGTVGVPFAKQFRGDWHGNLTDKYGIKWMVNG